MKLLLLAIFVSSLFGMERDNVWRRSFADAFFATYNVDKNPRNVARVNEMAEAMKDTGWLSAGWIKGATTVMVGGRAIHNIYAKASLKKSSWGIGSTLLSGLIVQNINKSIEDAKMEFLNSEDFNRNEILHQQMDRNIKKMYFASCVDVGLLFAGKAADSCSIM